MANYSCKKFCVDYPSGSSKNSLWAINSADKLIASMARNGYVFGGVIFRSDYILLTIRISM